MPRNKTFDSIAQAIGDTPMIRINRLVPPGQATVFAKCEFFQPLNSVKDRIGVAMIEAGEREGKVKKDRVASRQLLKAVNRRKKTPIAAAIP